MLLIRCLEMEILLREQETFFSGYPFPQLHKIPFVKDHDCLWVNERCCCMCRIFQLKVISSFQSLHSDPCNVQCFWLLGLNQCFLTKLMQLQPSSVFLFHSSTLAQNAHFLWNKVIHMCTPLPRTQQGCGKKRRRKSKKRNRNLRNKNVQSRG